MIFKPYKYQQFAFKHIIHNLSCGLFLEMGLGKTVITASAVHFLIYEAMEISRVLVIAPLRVATHVWPEELNRWDHLKGLTYSVVTGSARQRIKALNKPADIYIINRDNVAWLTTVYSHRWPFDCVIIDELSSFKSNNSVRFKELKKVIARSFRVIGLTGTPAPNSLIDLWPQMFLLDQGERLGETITSYRTRFFNEGKKNGHAVYKYNLKKGAKEYIYKKIGDICISMKSKDYLDLPDQLNRIIPIYFDDKLRKMYDDFEEDRVLEFIEHLEEAKLFGGSGLVTAANKGVLIGKLLQFASGAVYDEVRDVHVIHDMKIRAVEEIIDNLNGNPLLLFYNYKHSLSRLLKRFKKLRPSLLRSTGEINDWNKGKITLACVHPASAGHGLNLQFGGHNNVWYDNTYSLELYQQANARLLRPGQRHKVISNRLVAVGTMDEEVIKAQDLKERGQNALLDAVKARIRAYK